MTVWRAIVRVVALAGVGTACLVPAPLAAADIIVVDGLAPLGSVQNLRLNSNREITGDFSGATDAGAFFWKEGVATPLIFGPQTEGNAIADDGSVVGTFHDQGILQAYRWKGGVLELLSPGTEAEALAVNASGGSAGWQFELSDWNLHGVRWESTGAPVLLLPLSSQVEDEAHAMNEAGQIVGRAKDGSHVIRAVLWEGSSITNLGGLLAQDLYSQAESINESGQIVGWSRQEPNLYRAVAWEGGAATLLPDLGLSSGWSRAIGISDAGTIVGSVAGGGPARWQKLGAAWMLELLEGAYADLGWVIDGVEDIAGNGDILARGSHPDEGQQWILIVESCGRSSLASDQSIYNRPAPDPRHPGDSAIPSEHIDLVTGGLHLSYTDLALPGDAGHDLVLSRAYSSKLVVHDNEDESQSTGEPSSLGYGWQMHMGRLFVKDEHDEVFELPGARPQRFVTSWIAGGKRVSEDLWTLEDRDVDGVDYKVVTDTDGVEYRFRAEDEDRRKPGNEFFYVNEIEDRFENRIDVSYNDTFDDGWPYLATITSTSRTANPVRFEYDGSATWPEDHPSAPRSLVSVKWKDSDGVDATISFVVQAPVEGDCRSKLLSVTMPGGLTTSYGYDPATYELTGITLPTQAQVSYGYVDHLFRASYGPESSRVVASRSLSYDDPAKVPPPVTHSWTYAYPTDAAPDLPSTVTYPDLTSLQVTSLRYGTAPEHRVGLPASVVHRSSSALPVSTRTYTYGEDYAYGLDPDLLPIKLALPTMEDLVLHGTAPAFGRRTYSYQCTNLSCSTSWGDFATPREITDFEFGTAGPSVLIARRSELTYDPTEALLDRNLLNRPATMRIFDGTNPAPRRHRSYVWADGTGTNLPLGTLAVLSNHYDTLGGGSGPSVAVTTFQYDQAGNRKRQSRSAIPGLPRVENAEYTGGVLSKRYQEDSFNNLIFERWIDPNVGLVKTHTDPNSQVWSFDYDGADRIESQAVPGTYDPSSFEYDSVTRRDRVTSGTFETIQQHDQLGRLDYGQTVLEETGPGVFSYSYRRTGYDWRGRVNRVYEPDLAPPIGAAPHTAFTYDVLGRMLTRAGVSTNEGTTTYAWDGSKVLITPPVGPAWTEEYTALGFLKSVTDQNGVTTTYDYEPTGELTCVDGPLTVQSRTRLYNTAGFLLSDSTPESGSTYYVYDESGRVISQQDADLTTTNRTFDPRGRLKTAASSGGPAPAITRLFGYDCTPSHGMNRLCTIEVPERGSLIEVKGYDEQGRILELHETIKGITFRTLYTYTGQGMVDTVTYPHPVAPVAQPPRTLLDYGYTRSNQVASIWRNGGPVVSSLNYSPAFSPQTLAFDGGVTLTRTAGPGTRYQPTGIVSAGSTPVLNLQYTAFRPDGLIEEILTNGRADFYTYDNLNRLATARYGPIGTPDVVSYQYDPNGNLLSQSSSNPTWNGLPGFSFNHVIDEHNQVDALSYSATGRPSVDLQGNHYGYGSDGELVQMSLAPPSTTQIGYSYNGRDEQVWRAAGGPSGPTGLEEFYLHDLGGNVISLYTRDPITGTLQAKLDYLRANGEVLGSVEYRPGSPSQPAKYELAYLSDHIGSVRRVVIRKSDGAADGRTYRVGEYFPHGYTKAETDLISMPPANQPDIRHGFQGHRREPGTLMWNFGARYLHTGLGRFLTTDPVLDVDPGNPHTWNKYGFVRGNPLLYTDPDGRVALKTDKTLQGTEFYYLGFEFSSLLSKLLGIVPGIPGGDADAILKLFIAQGYVTTTNPFVNNAVKEKFERAVFERFKKLGARDIQAPSMPLNQQSSAQDQAGLDRLKKAIDEIVGEWVKENRLPASDEKTVRTAYDIDALVQRARDLKNPPPADAPK